MKKTLSILGALGLILVASGCAHSSRLSAGKGNVGVNSRAHGWETPHFSADLKSNPVKSELGLGFVTLGSQAGCSDHPTGQWFSLGLDVGPDAKPAPEPNK